MLFKKNEEKASLKQEIRSKRIEIRELRKLHKKWIASFMKERDPTMAAIQMIVIRTQAVRIAEAEDLLILMKKHYKLI